MLDVIAGGRLVAGFPVGTSMDTNYAYGPVPGLLRERCAEAHELVRGAWAEDEPFVFNGRYTKLRYANCWPKPCKAASTDLHTARSRPGISPPRTTTTTRIRAFSAICGRGG
jgi:alkanesulfonate monooxygenase SsuD/methylene tetrahydromethanopterin reductase-like flavin-dependent oxidoreductase (luciferase family)